MFQYIEVLQIWRIGRANAGGRRVDRKNHGGLRIAS
jgi:hypothetical protein